MCDVRREWGLSIGRLLVAFDEARSSVGRWVRSPKPKIKSEPRRCPVSGCPDLREKIKAICLEPRERMRGYRMVRALLRRRHNICVSRKTVNRVMRELGLTQPRMHLKPLRPKRVERMRPNRPNQGWQIDMTSFQRCDLRPVYLVTIIDCFTRQLVGWHANDRCKATDWSSAVRMALESRGMATKEACSGLVLRSDNGAQPSSKHFVEFLGKCGIKGQYTGYNAPDDNAYVERIIRTIKEEEIWCSDYESLSEARECIDDYVRYYNRDRLHSSLDYQTPDEIYEIFTSTQLAA